MPTEVNHAAVREEQLKGAAGNVFVRSWRPAGRARAVVAIVPGFNSHSGYYSWVAEQLTSNGLAVYAVDLRGRWRSDRERFYDETQPTETVAALVRADERLDDEFPRFTLPLLILHGTEDKATKPSGSQKFYDKASSADKTLKLYEGHFHDLLNDVDKANVMGDIKSWIDARLS